MSEEKKFNELEETELDNISGGLVYDASGTPEAVPGLPWEVLHNNNGKILGRYSTQGEACEAAKKYKSGSKYDTQLVSKEEVDYLRSHPQTF
ncbi:MAG: bacteriocin [Lachnospiraceae bacterium]|nr:bacteriocin [Lachnospiraceae bacterium]